MFLGIEIYNADTRCQFQEFCLKLHVNAVNEVAYKITRTRYLKQMCSRGYIYVETKGWEEKRREEKSDNIGSMQQL
jgi:hypothetical protein